MTAVLNFVLFLLKCLGILLLAILGLLLLVAVVALFAPVRYRGRLEKKEAPEEIFRADGLVSWLNPFLRIRIRYTEKKLHYTVRIFGICLLDSDKPKKEKPVKEKKKNVKKANKKNKKQESDAALPASEGHETAEGAGNPVTGGAPVESETTGTTGVSGGANPSEAGEATEQTLGETAESGESDGKKKSGLFAKIKQFIEKIKAIPERIKQKAAHIVNTGKLLWYKKEKAVAFLQDELHKTALGTAWTIVKQMLRHVLPGKIKGKIEFGTGDPESTGKALGVMGVLYAWYGKGVTVVPDFYEKRIVAELEFKGRVRLGTLLAKGLRLIRDKQIKRFIKNFKKLLKVLKQKAE